MIALDASRILVMSAALMVVTCADRLASAAGDQADFAVGGHAVRNLGAAEIKPDHQRREQCEFDRRNAAPVTRESRKPSDDVNFQHAPDGP